MNVFRIAWKSLAANRLTSFLNILLIAFGIAILSILLLATSQVSQKLENSAKDIDLVVGAKGSPLQLILSSIYHIDFPTGNIPLNEAKMLSRSPMVKRAVPLALGDNFNGSRIVGTDTNFISLYGLKLAEGKFWNRDLEVTIGANVAQSQKLKAGDHFKGAHGLTESGEEHREASYQVTGILQPQGNVTDNLIITNVASIWKMHGSSESEITSLLIQYRSPMSLILFPRMVNESTNMQAASPARESARLFSLIGIGVDALQWFAVLIMAIAAISVFISLYNSLKERKYDLAIMRTLGASRYKIFCIILLEGIILSSLGTLAGTGIGHLGMHLIGQYQESQQARLSGLIFIPAEGYLMLAGLALGIVAAIIPSVQAYKSDISKILASA